MKSRHFDQPITFQRATVTQDAAGEEVLTWATLAQRDASVIYGRGDERRAAAAEEGRQAVTFQVWSDESTRTVTLKDRISYDGDTFDLVGIAPNGRDTIDFDTVRAL